MGNVALLLISLACSLAVLGTGGCARFSGPLDWSTAAAASGKPAEQVTWAQPLHGGPLRMVFVAPRYAWSDARALSERLDVRIEPVAAQAPDGEESWPAGLRAALETSPEVIVLAAFPAGALPPDAIEAVLAQVRAGAGLVLAHYGEGMPGALESALEGVEFDEGPPDLLETSGGALMPEWRRGDYFAEFGMLGEGRVAMLDYAGGRPFTHALLARPELPREMLADHRESWYGMLSRVLLWASGRSAPLSIVAVTQPDGGRWDERTVPPEMPEEFIQTMREATISGPTRLFEVTLSEPAPRGTTLEWQLRAPARRARVGTPEPLRVPEGDERAAFPVSAMAGSYYLDVWLSHRGRVVDWRTQAVTIDAWPVIHEVTFSHTRLKPHDILGLRVTVPPVTRPARAVTIHARALDGFQTAGGGPRIVAEACVTAAPEQGPVELHLNLIDLISPTLRVEVYASEHPCDMIGPATRARSAFAARSFTVDVEQEENFPLIADAPLPNEYGLRDAFAALAEGGVSTLHLEAGPALLDAVAEAGLRAMPRLHPEWTVRAIAGGLPDLGASTALQEAAWWAWREGSKDAVLEAPGIITPREAVARSPGFEEEFAALRGESATAEQGAAGDIVDQVVLHLLADQAGLDEIALGLIEVEEVAPALRLGLALSPDDAAFLRADWARLAPGLTFAGSRPEALLLRRMAAYLPDSGRAYSYVGMDEAETSRAEAARWAWQARVRGAAGLWRRGRSVPGDYERPGQALLDMTGQPSAAFAGLMEGVNDLRQGPAALLADARPGPAPVVIVDSRASFWLNEADPLFPGNTLPSQAAWLSLLEGMGHACRFVSAESLSGADLEDARVAVLPMCRALGDDAWRALEDFAARGGHILADVLPAAHDGVGGPRPVDAAARMFGVTVSPDAEAPQPRTVSIRMAGDADADADSELDTEVPDAADSTDAPGVPVAAIALDGLVLDPSVQAAAAQAFGGDEGMVAWLRHDEDAGMRLLLNHPLMPFEPGEYGEILEQLRNWLDDQLESAGVEPAVRLRGGGQLPPGTEHAHFQYGDARIVAVLGPGGSRRSTRVVLDLGEEGHVYEPRTGERHANASRVRVRLDGSHAALLCVLPYRVDELEVISPSEVTAGRRLELAARVVAREGLPGRHLLRIEVSTLEGEVLEHYTRHLAAAGGVLRTYVPLARNEQPGWYRVTVRDLLTGTVAESRFVVAPRTD